METVNDQVTSIQRRSETDEMVEDLERLYRPIHKLLDAGNSEALKLRALDYAWLILIHGDKPADKMVVVEHGDHL